MKTKTQRDIYRQVRKDAVPQGSAHKPKNAYRREKDWRKWEDGQ